MISVVFPGQGSQKIGMGSDFFSKFDYVKAIFEDADEILGYKISEIILNGPQEKLNQTTFTQPAIYLIGYIICEILKKKFEFYDDGFEGERVTPTGAAIIRYLNDHLKTSLKPTTLISSGYGLGSRKKTEYNNFLRLNAYKKNISEQYIADDQVVVLSFELDDQTAEDISIGIEKVLNFDSVLDVVQYPVYSKKQRIATSLRILCKLEEQQQIIDECFNQFNTLGIRYEITKRLILPRKIKKITVRKID